MLQRIAALFVLAAPFSPGAEWAKLFNGRDLSGWESVGDGVWTVTAEGVLVGQRNLLGNERLRAFTFGDRVNFTAWLYQQAWLYTVKEFGEYDLSLEYWLRHGGNSGVSIRDRTRARHAVSTPADFSRTPAKVAYEIQLANHYPDKNPSGSIYNLARAAPGAQIDDDWNRLEIESRKDSIRVKLNGKLVAEHPGLPDRPPSGPIGLQLHDQFSVVMFRDIRIREIP